MKIVLHWLAAMVILSLPSATDAQSMSDCRAKPKLLELGVPLTTARKAIAEHQKTSYFDDQFFSDGELQPMKSCPYAYPHPA